MGVLPWSPLAGGWLSGRYRKGKDVPESRRAALVPDRYDMSNPANQAKLEAADALAELAADAGISLIEMSLAFLLEHPAVTAPIIGPRTMEQLESQLPAAEIRLSPDVLDRIDEIVPPGTTVKSRPTTAGRPRRSPTRAYVAEACRVSKGFYGQSIPSSLATVLSLWTSRSSAGIGVKPCAA